MSKPKTIADHWEAYSRIMDETGTSPDDKVTARMAFYCGATALLGLMRSYLIDDGDDVTDREMARMEDLVAELDRFKMEVTLKSLVNAIRVRQGS